MAAWAVGNLVAAVGLGFWALLGFTLDEDGCGSRCRSAWLAVDAVAAGLAVAALAAWAVSGGHRSRWLTAATAVLIVPVFHTLRS